MCEILTQWERVNQWCLALESGLYTQGHGDLRFQSINGEHKYCCLGVACNVFKKITGKGGWTEYNKFTLDGQPVTSDTPEAEIESGNISHFVNDWLFGDIDTLPDGDQLIPRLVQMNDSSKASFKDIAAWVRENVLPLCSKEKPAA